MGNTLYYGDNLDILQRYVADASVDLVYLDPPFNSNTDYNVLFAEKDGSDDASQVQAFEDTWRWNNLSESTYGELMGRADRVSECVQAFRTFLGTCDLLAYLVMMAPRLAELRRVMKPTASIYLHCDPTASHYLKMLMDAVFGEACFRNEIIWSYRRWPSPTKAFQRMHDVILFYAASRTGPGTFNVEYEANSPSYEKRFKGKTQMLDPETGTRKITLDAESKGLPRRDVWELSIIAGVSKERLGYQTQKPLTLLERIIDASSNPGDVVLDPFCGCGTTIEAAQKLRRQWIGIDVTHLAINLIKQRLRHSLESEAKAVASPRAASDAGAMAVAEGEVKGDAWFRQPYVVVGEPTSLTGAAELAAKDPMQFQYWALGLIDARPLATKHGADRGIDGKLVFPGDGKGKYDTIIVQVKAGQHVSVQQIRDLRGVIEREQAVMGIFITMHSPTRPMVTEAVSAGMWHSIKWNHEYPRLQIATVEDMLAEHLPDTPPRQMAVTFRRAPTQRAAALLKQPDLLTEPEAGE